MSELYGDDYDSVSGRGGVSSGVRRLAGAILFLALIGALGLWAYRLGTRDAAEVPIIRAMEGPARVQPEEPGGLRAAHQGLEVNAVLAGEPAPVPEATAPLVPAPGPLADEDAPQGELVVAAPPIVPEAELAEGADLRMPLPDEGPAAAEAVAAPEPSAPAQAGGTIAPAAMVAAAIAEAEAAAAEPTPEVAALVPAAGPGPRPLRRPSNLPAARAAAPAPAEGAARVAAAREVASVDAGARLVQLGAFDSEAITRQAWNILVSRHGDLLGGKSLYVERTTANARVFYRLRVAGFDSADQTRQMCEALRARSVDCIPVTLN